MSMRTAAKAFVVLATALCSLQARAEFHLQEATIDGIHAAIRAGETDLQAGRRGIHRARQGLQRHVHEAGHRRWREGAEGARRRARGLAAEVSHRHGSARTSSSRTSTSTRGSRRTSAAWRPTMSDPARAPAVRHGRRHSECRAGQCARDAQHSRRALGDLQGQVRCAARHRRFRPARRQPAMRSASIPMRSNAQPRSIASTAAIPISRRCPLYCVPMSFKAIYDAKDMRSTGGGDVNYAMDAAPKDSTLIARLRARRRDHLRTGAQLRIQRRQRRSGRRREGRASLHRAGRLA